MLRSSLLILFVSLLISCDDSAVNNNAAANKTPEVQVDSVGPNEDTPQEPDYMNKGLNPLAENWVIDTINPPIIKWDTNHYNFGKIKQGEKVEHNFEFTNVGKSPLIIKEAYGNCGCTIPHYPTEPIAPEGSGKIKVVFNSSNKLNRIYKQVVVIANTYPEDANVISIGATVNK